MGRRPRTPEGSCASFCAGCALPFPPTATFRVRLGGGFAGAKLFTYLGREQVDTSSPYRATGTWSDAPRRRYGPAEAGRAHIRVCS
jgi:hypothetical protein